MNFWHGISVLSHFIHYFVQWISLMMLRVMETKVSGNHRHFLQLDGLLGGLLSCSLGCTFVGIVTAQIGLLAETEISHEFWVHLKFTERMNVLQIRNGTLFDLHRSGSRDVCVLDAWCHSCGPSGSGCDWCDSLTLPTQHKGEMEANEIIEFGYVDIKYFESCRTAASSASSCCDDLTTRWNVRKLWFSYDLIKSHGIIQILFWLRIFSIFERIPHYSVLNFMLHRCNSMLTAIPHKFSGWIWSVYHFLRKIRSSFVESKIEKRESRSEELRVHELSRTFFMSTVDDLNAEKSLNERCSIFLNYRKH